MVVGTVSSEGLPPGWQEVHAEGRCTTGASFDSGFFWILLPNDDGLLYCFRVIENAMK